ncbi:MULTISPECIES: DUF58 domain-containing protein [unclassified Chelatococcus]|uniref:DUF58 domain-containing protein n=1 Tax=unclassified Chelatococcus TaxID=2638111 RepID=UPI001BD08EBA|nr:MULTISPECIES: DUF58 domain-containing protein [unclassified Chelatococcus]MBS7697737.1 DUF58 domain-containing protein [Chelatococcus sp. YT9]MBX3558406.1 DUF58 domain-containing protein [Chelatococcus sp.]
MARVQVLPLDNRSPGRREADAAMSLAERLPRIVLEARRVSASVAHGIHGRRRAGTGESFWQFRPFTSGEAMARIDWRRSARDDRLYVREREWEAAQSVWLWMDRSASMGFTSTLASASKIERALVIGLALADALVEGGERIGLMGAMPPRASRRIVELVAEALVADTAGLKADLPPPQALPPLNEAILISDFLVEPSRLRTIVETIAARGARGHCVMIIDPVEETFPFHGQAELENPEDGTHLRIGDATSWGEDYRRRIARHREEVAAAFAGRGWTLSLHHTDQPASSVVLRLLNLIATSRGAAALQPQALGR